MTLTLLEILYVTGIVFLSVIGVLITIVLVKVIKLLNTAEEIVSLYTKTKQFFGIYERIPQAFTEKIFSFFK